MRNYMKYKGLIGSVSYSDDDKIFFGKIEGINDLVTFEGESVDALEKAFHEMAEAHIQDCKNKGVAVEKSYKGSLNIRLNPELHKILSIRAAMEGISLNQVINNALATYTSIK